MRWKKQLEKLEHNKDWDSAIKLMENVISEKPNSLDAYLDMNYLLMNLLVEEDYDESKHDYYAKLLKKYFDESYLKFSHNPEYLFFIARIACMSEWYFDIEIEEAEKMLEEAMQLDPDNIIYQWTYYGALDTSKQANRDKVVTYAQKITAKNSSVKSRLKSKGALGEYIWSMMQHWAERMLRNNFL